MWGPHGYTVRHGVVGTLLGIAPTPPACPHVVAGPADVMVDGDQAVVMGDRSWI